MSKALEIVQSRRFDLIAAKDPTEFVCNALACQQRLKKDPV